MPVGRWWSTTHVNFIAEPGQAEVVYEPLLLLRTLFAQCPPELKPQFVPLLLNQMTPTNSMTIGHVVVDAGELRRLRPYIQSFTMFYRPICKALDQKLAMESHRFTEPDLDWIEEAQAPLRASRLKEQQSVARDSPVWWLTRLKSRIDRSCRYSKNLNVRFGLIQPIFLFELSGKARVQLYLRRICSNGVANVLLNL